ncbi:aspartate aminotransferase family protein, partial [Pseudomonas aeruginosa]
MAPPVSSELNLRAHWMPFSANRNFQKDPRIIVAAEGSWLTDEGREVYRATQTLLAALEGFRAEVNDLHQHLRGELNIGII